MDGMMEVLQMQQQYHDHFPNDSLTKKTEYKPDETYQKNMSNLSNFIFLPHTCFILINYNIILSHNGPLLLI